MIMSDPFPYSYTDASQQGLFYEQARDRKMDLVESIPLWRFVCPNLSLESVNANP